MKNAVLPPSTERESYLEKVREVERACCLDSERVMAVSDEDALRLQDLYGVPRESIVVVPNGMDFDTARLNTLPPSERKTLKARLGLDRSPVCLFVGSAHGPNIEALQVLEALAQKCPESIFLIVGSVCNSSKASTAPPNMRLLGVLSEAEKIVVLNASDIALNPVTSGSGSNLKLLEYIAYSIPVITTPFGLRGYALKHKEHLLVADVEAFSAVLKKEALSNMPALQAMAQRALAFASSRYNWSEIAGEGFEGSRVQGVEGRRRVQGFEGSRVRGFEGSRVQGVKGLRG
jgi:glycosyltransferase involved in cell wall biosynthesis